LGAQTPWIRRAEGVFIAFAVGEPIRVNGISKDAAWISWEEGEDEGTAARAPYFKLHKRDEG
jgi:hypothetical protein